MRSAAGALDAARHRGRAEEDRRQRQRRRQQNQGEQRGAELQQRLGVRDKGLVPKLYQDGSDATNDDYIAMERIAGQSLARS